MRSHEARQHYKSGNEELPSCLEEARQFVDARLVGVDFSDTLLSGARLGNVDLAGVNFSNVLLQGASFDHAHVGDACVDGAVLTGVAAVDLPFTRPDLKTCVRDLTRTRKRGRS